MAPFLRWGLLSTARINAKLIPAIQLSDRSKLTAVASRDLARAEKYASEWNIPNTFGSYADMIASDSIDAVYISLPNDQHAEWSVRALEAGKHVLCEKPMAISNSEIAQMIAAAKSSGCVLTEAFMYLHHPQTRMVLDVVRSGKIGQVHAIHGSFHFRLANLEDIRAIPTMGGGSIWDVGVYPISYIQQLLGSAPEEVNGWQHIGSTGIDMTFAAQMRYASGAVAQFTSSFESPFHMRLDIFGTEGRLEITRPFAGIENGTVEFFAVEGASQHLLAADKHLYLGEIEDMESSALDGKPQLLSLSETDSHIRTVLALIESAHKNQPVTCGWSIA